MDREDGRREVTGLENELKAYRSLLDGGVSGRDTTGEGVD